MARPLYEPIVLEWEKDGTWYGRVIIPTEELYEYYVSSLAETSERYFYPLKITNRVRISYLEEEY